MVTNFVSTCGPMNYVRVVKFLKILHNILQMLIKSLLFDDDDDVRDNWDTIILGAVKVEKSQSNISLTGDIYYFG